MADIVYVASGYLEPGYTVYTADAGSSLTSTARLPDDPYIVSDYVTSGYFFTPTLNATVTKSISRGLTVVITTTVTGARTRTASAAANNTATVTVSAARRRSGAGAVTVTATVTAIGRFQQQASAVLTSRITTTVTATVTRPAGANLTAFDTIAVTALANKNFTAGLTASSTLSATAGVTRDAGYPVATVTWDSQDSSWDDWQHQYWDPDRGIWIRSTSSLYGFPVVSGSQQYLLESIFTIYPNGGHKRTGSATTTAIARVFTIGGYEKTTGATITAVSTVSAAPTKLHSTTSAALESSVAVSASAEVIPPTRGTAAITSTSSVAVNGGRLQQGASGISSAFTVEAQGKLPGIQEMDPLGITARFTTASAISRSLVGASVITATVSVSPAAARTRNISQALTSVATVTSVPTRTRPGAGAFFCVFTQSTTFTRVRSDAGAVTGSFQITSLGGKRQPASGAFVVQASLTGLGGRRRDGTASLSANGFILSDGDVFTIDPDFQIRVVQESRTYPVLAESRLLSTQQETRVNIILPEARSIIVPEETRQELIL